MKKPSHDHQSDFSGIQEKSSLIELKKWKTPEITSVSLSMTEGKDAQWFEGPAFVLNWSAAPS